MRVVNKLTKPGDIRRVDLTPDIVRIETSDGRDRVYRLVSTVGDNGSQEAQDEDKFATSS